VAGEDVLAGMVIVVPATSIARRLAAEHEVELHLLAVAPELRKAGLGERLVKAAVELGRARGASKMWLWTQPAMTAAHRLYEREGFTRVEALDFERGGRTFLVLERTL
jgi:ribosomal protein S18 acetylase RimI-like enzyme